MALPVIPNHPTQQLRLKADISQSCNLNQTTNISLRGLSINNPSLTYNTTFRTILPSTSDSTTNGSLANWLVAVNLDPSYDQTDPNQHKMSEFPVGRSVESDGYLPR
tara:strand:- start:300 stop:620 length:321 start_codon:yes stop_codon:yes gene_type:complete